LKFLKKITFFQENNFILIKVDIYSRYFNEIIYPLSSVDYSKFVDRLINCFQQKKVAIERNRLQQKELGEKA
jgi:hypothetical protein